MIALIGHISAVGIRFALHLGGACAGRCAIVAIAAVACVILDLRAAPRADRLRAAESLAGVRLKHVATAALCVGVLLWGPSVQQKSTVVCSGAHPRPRRRPVKVVGLPGPIRKWVA